MQDYFAYLPETPMASVWGCTATSTGFTRVPPGSPYPPKRHPSDHHFTWERGRVLQAHLLVLISEGRGTLECGSPPRKWPIEAGMLFVVLPGQWHRYAPNPTTGWVEHWIEMRGPALERAQERCLVSEEHPVFDMTSAAALHECFLRVHDLASTDALGNQSLLSTLGLHLLALLTVRPLNERDRLAVIVQKAQVLITARADRPVNVEHIARELKIGYSHFRQAFKARTGVSPKHYHQTIRIRRAQELLANTDRSLEEIADALGFSSAFHLSRQFKQMTGSAPRHWKHKITRRE